MRRKQRSFAPAHSCVNALLRLSPSVATVLLLLAIQMQLPSSAKCWGTGVEGPAAGYVVNAVSNIITTNPNEPTQACPQSPNPNLHLCQHTSCSHASSVKQRVRRHTESPDRMLPVLCCLHAWDALQCALHVPAAGLQLYNLHQSWVTKLQCRSTQ